MDREFRFGSVPDGYHGCSKCSEVKPVADFYKYRSGETYSWCKRCVSIDSDRTRKQRKIDALAYKGNACQQCGETFHPAGMSFHHRDPTQKDFSISGANARKLESIKEELDKCDLLCLVCHAIEHAGDWSEWGW